MSAFDESIPSDDDTVTGGEFSDEIDGAAHAAGGGSTGTSERDLGDGSDALGGSGLDPDDAPTTDTTVGDTAAADAEFEGRPLDDVTRGEDSATSADSGFGDSAPEHPSSDTEETLPPSDLQPDSQGEDPLLAELGEQGEGDLSPEDV